MNSTALASVVLLGTLTMASAQTAPPNCSDADFTKLCVSRGDNAQTCACLVRTMHEVLTPDEIKWACWFQSNPDAAQQALEAFKEPDKAEAMGLRLIDRGHIINQRCAEVR